MSLRDSRFQEGYKKTRDGLDVVADSLTTTEYVSKIFSRSSGQISIDVGIDPVFQALKPGASVSIENTTNGNVKIGIGVNGFEALKHHDDSGIVLSPGERTVFIVPDSSFPLMAISGAVSGVVSGHYFS